MAPDLASFGPQIFLERSPNFGTGIINMPQIMWQNIMTTSRGTSNISHCKKETGVKHKAFRELPFRVA